MSGRLTGKSVLITGASAGIGWATALALAAEGADLFLTARRISRLEALTQVITDAGGRATFLDGDASQEETAVACIAETIRQYGKLDILINNAGMGSYKPLTQFTTDEYDELMDTNMRSTFVFSRRAVEVMLPRKSGLILTISSVAGIHGYANEAIYCATKFAQRGFMQALDHELRPSGIRVGLVCPGGVKTEFAIGRGRTPREVAESGMMKPGEVADAVLLVCTAPATSRIAEIVMRSMVEPLA
jgi:NADP-dependent 3-hydroxy acid dehydrogenase YdfG